MSPTPAELFDTWRGTAVGGEAVQLFYGHHDRADDPWFSNFYVHEPFDFAIPPWCGVHGGQETAPIEFSEKAIMLCKASLMGDAETFARVAAAQTPAEAKRLGRLVEPWDEERWQMHVCDIARHVALAKFAGVPGLRERLLATGERLIAEAAPNDRVWGIGLAKKDPDARCPWKWRGANVLGWALMRAREALRSHAVDAAVGVPPRPGDSAQGKSLARAAQLVQSFDGDVVVLVSHGSFNPVHVDHLHMMVRARNVVHEQHTSAEAPDAPKKRHGRKLLVLGVFGITDESWLQRKGLAPEDCFSDDERVKMLELATAADDWLFVADATLSTKAPSAKVLIKMLQTQEVFPEKTKAKRKVRFIRVMGSDVCRRDDVKATTREVIVVDRDESIGHSSTQVRKALRERNCEYLVRAVPQSVRECLLSTTNVRSRVYSDAVGEATAETNLVFAAQETSSHVCSHFEPPAAQDSSAPAPSLSSSSALRSSPPNHSYT